MARHAAVRRAARLLATVAVAAATVAAVSGCGDGYASYCDAVGAHQQALGQALSAGPAQGLLQALPALEDLQSRSPSDVRGDWDQVVTAVQGLQSALRSAGVDPATYQAARPPAGVTASQRARIAAAASALGAPATVTSWGNVQQQVRDVCHTQLFVGA